MSATPENLAKVTPVDDFTSDAVLPGPDAPPDPAQAGPSPPRGQGAGHEHMRILEAVLFAAAEPLDPASLMARLPAAADFPALIADLQADYATRGVNLVQLGGRWAFRTADDLAFVMHREMLEQKRLSRAALETLAIIAYHQPVTRADIEEIRGVSISKGTLDILLQSGWVRLRGRRRSPGRPVTYGTTDGFLDHFSLSGLDDLPGLDELKAVGLLKSAPPGGFPTPAQGDEDDQTSRESADADCELAREQLPGETAG